VGFGDLTLFAAGGGFGDGCGLGPASSFDTFCRSGASGFFGLAKRTDCGVGLIGGRCACGGCGLACGCVGHFSGGFGLGLGEERVFAYLFGGTMSQLSAILPARGREVAVLCPMKVGPGVERRHIFRSLLCCQIVDLIRAARIHSS
jgi:hypothetical protein